MRRQRVSAYAICVRGDDLLLARWIEGHTPLWTMPGGGVEHGEDPFDAVVREVEEETGYHIEVDGLLGIDSYHPREEFHAVRVFYVATVVGGELRHEVGGSTDQAAWFPLGEVKELARSEVIDRALELYQVRPITGHL
ncbi:NUDIX hydrolase [Nonomuraea sediminis]|uniref:NUDIX hydrolase n=1 Tax=Nonomuraea sediminis TaxID=2835864 RepID=UPI001BDC6ECC|nr:NUDIX hydrolase [Nonomuraea sediminis]